MRPAWQIVEIMARRKKKGNIEYEVRRQVWCRCVHIVALSILGESDKGLEGRRRNAIRVRARGGGGG